MATRTLWANRPFFELGGQVVIFGTSLVRLLAKALAEKRQLFSLIVLLDFVAGAARILAVLVVAFAAKLISEQTIDEIGGYELNITASLSTIVLLGVVLAFAALAGGLCVYASVRFSRKLGRWANRQAMERMLLVMSRPPSETMRSRFSHSANLNSILVQLPIHTGLATETIARMINPLFLFLLSTAALAWQDAIFAGVVFLSGLAALPVYVKISQLTQRNAREFYSSTSAVLGAEVSGTAALLANQHGIVPEKIERTDRLLNSANVDRFFDSYDTNLLANERTNLVVSIADAVLRAVIFVWLCSLVFLDRLSIEETIAFLGALTYMVGAVRSTNGLLTNLMRYFPQVNAYLQFADEGADMILGSVDKAKKFPDQLAIEVDGIAGQGKQTTTVEPGEISLLKIDGGLTSLSIGELLSPYLGSDSTNASLLNNLVFVNSLFRFAPVSVIDQLSGGRESDAYSDRVKEMCAELGCLDAFEILPQAFNSELDERVWGHMSATARFALRVVPIVLNPGPKIVFLDSGVVSGAGNQGIEFIRSTLSDSFICIVVVPGAAMPRFDADRYFDIRRSGGVAEGDREWFQGVVTAAPENAAGQATQIQSESLL